MIPTPPTRAALEAAADAWGLNCGPAALCAVTGLSPDGARLAFGPTWPGYTNPTAMRAAAEAAGLRVVERPTSGPPSALSLVRVQWGGPWTAPGANARWAYQHTHWIAEVRHDGNQGVWDVNVAGWTILEWWAEKLVPLLLPRRADGTWWRTHVWEVVR